MMRLIGLKIIFAILYGVVFCISIKSTYAEDNCRLSTLEEEAAYPKYYWTLVIDYPPDSQYTIERDDDLIAYNDCGTIEGFEGYIYITDLCPGLRTMNVYLLMSNEQLLWQVRDLGGCKGVLRSSSLGYYDIKDVFQKINYQVNILETYWRMVEDYYGNWVCDLPNGKIAYAIDVYSVPVDYQEVALSWSIIPTNSPEIDEVIRNLGYQNKKVITAYKASNFYNTEFGKIYSNHNFAYARSGQIAGDYGMKLYSQDETTACYCWSNCKEPSPDLFCFDVVGIVEDYKLEDRKVIFKSSELGLLVRWPY